MPNNTNNTKALGLMSEKVPAIISPSPNNKTRELSTEKLGRCPFCGALLDLSEAMRQAILALANAATSL
jgi:hypothetical protein